MNFWLWIFALFFVISCSVETVCGSFNELVGKTTIAQLMSKPKFTKEIKKFLKTCPRPDLFTTHLSAIKAYIRGDSYSRDFQMDSEFASEGDRLVYAINCTKLGSKLTLKAYDPKGHLLYVDYWPDYPGTRRSTVIYIV